MKVGGYTLDLYCDTDGCDAVYRHGIKDRFAGHDKRDCVKQAKAVGWHVGYKHQYCPTCTGKRVYESDLDTQTMTPEDLMNIPEGPFTYKREGD